MGNMHPQSINEHCKVRVAMAPDRIARFYRPECESKLADRDFIHRVGSHDRILARRLRVNQMKAPTSSKDVYGSGPNPKTRAGQHRHKRGMLPYSESLEETGNGRIHSANFELGS